MHKTRVLFLGTKNAARSQMAEALLRKRAGDHFESYSAGLDPDDISAYTRTVLEEIGLDLESQRAKKVTEYLGRVHFGYVITVCNYAEQNCPTAFMGVAHRLHWTVEDPLKFHGSEAEILAKFQSTRDEIDRLILAWVGEQT